VFAPSVNGVIAAYC